MSNSLYARDPITGAFKELAAVESAPGIWGLVVDQSVSAANSNLTTRIDDLGTTLYVGKAPLGSSEAAAVWQIFRLLETGAVSSIQWPAGSDSFTNVWADRASLSYS
jgi:hypothetical protein